MKTSTPPPIKILLVDDDDMVRSSLLLCLELFDDFQVVGEAANGQVAVDLCSTISPDVIVMDTNMPVMDGMEATRIISQLYPQTAIIVLTGYESTIKFMKSEKAGVDSYLVKVASLDELVTAIRQAYFKDKRKYTVDPGLIASQKNSTSFSISE